VLDVKMKGQTWVSAALYTALGVVTIALVLAVGMPILEDLKDKNTVTQTKDLILDFDEVIKETFEGAGSQREFFIDVKKGDFVVDGGSDEILWKMKTKAKLMEPGVELDEGNLKIRFDEIGEEYEMNVKLEFDVDLKINGENEDKKLLGRYNVLVKNKGGGVIDIIFE
tara:strand:- start:2027 stop:2530 length:504 start_codon:yes stop_codon:yes gene_type:complete